MKLLFCLLDSILLDSSSKLSKTVYRFRQEKHSVNGTFLQFNQCIFFFEGGYEFADLVVADDSSFIDEFFEATLVVRLLLDVLEVFTKLH